MDPFGIVAAFAGFVERYLIRRRRISLRADAGTQPLMSDGVHTVSTRQAWLYVYNGGPGRITINGAGWEARDGTRVAAKVLRSKHSRSGRP
jgi:hypothetical protein